ncbi:MAG: hypothetical protein JWP80_438 [Pseudomonas sp.]|nr:hypothetical protein [Pseudomonas sp.]
MRTLLPAVLLFVSVAGVAGEFSVTKSMSPGSIYKPPQRGVSVFHVQGNDYPRGAKTVSTLNRVDWSTTLYPTATNEKVEICLVYFGKYDCQRIGLNMTGTTTFSTPFRYASFVVIRHKLETSVLNSRPAGQDTVRFNFSY